MRIAAAALLVFGTSLAAQPAHPPGPAETNVRISLARIAQIDPQLHSVIAIDPTAIDQARRIDASGVRGPLAGRPVLIKDNIEAAVHCRRPPAVWRWRTM